MDQGEQTNEQQVHTQQQSEQMTPQQEQNNDNPQPCQQQQGNQYQQMQYDEQQYIPDDEQYMNYMAEEVKMQEVQEFYQNSQFDLKNLLVKIIKKVQYINQITCLGFDWSIMLYSVCRWNQEKCNTLTINGLHKDEIGYTNQFINNQGWHSEGICQVCCLYNLLIMNICGHQYCENCWIDYFDTSLRNRSQNPFPKCMNDSCKVRISYTVTSILTSDHNELNQFFQQCLCRDYATHNNFVKICKGRPGINCTKCFSINKMLDIIQCQHCGNLVCPRCGQRSHGTSQCTNILRWKKVGQTTMGMLQYYNYQQCPACKHGVERTAGCNEMVCRCKNKFCYICGQKWDPHHPSGQNGADYCPNFKKIQEKYKSVKMRKKLNIIKFCFRIEDKREQLQTFDFIFEQIQNLRQQMPKLVKVFLDNFSFHKSQLNQIELYCSFAKKVICILIGQAINDYFIKNQQRVEFFCNGIKQNLKKIKDFLLGYVLKQYKLLTKTTPLLAKKQQFELQNQQKQNFYQNYFVKLKQLQEKMIIIMRITNSQFGYDISLQKDPK